MNRITDNLKIGTVRELLVQLRLLEHDVQAAPPIKDSGNDLIAVRGESFRAIQIKTTTGNNFDKPNPDRKYHILAVVQSWMTKPRSILTNHLYFSSPGTKSKRLQRESEIWTGSE